MDHQGQVKLLFKRIYIYICTTVQTERAFILGRKKHVKVNRAHIKMIENSEEEEDLAVLLDYRMSEMPMRGGDGKANTTLRGFM